jgi:hypothetical protein
LAASAAHAITLLMILVCAYLLDLPRDRGLMILLAAAPVICLGPLAAVTLFACFVWAALRTDRLFSPAEKELIVERWRDHWQRWIRFRGMKGLGIRD